MLIPRKPIKPTNDANNRPHGLVTQIMTTTSPHPATATLPKAQVVIVWLRRDLRLTDQAALYYAQRYAKQHSLKVQLVFVFDRAILDLLDDKTDARVTFIHNALTAIQTQLLGQGATLDVFYGSVADAQNHWHQKYDVRAVFVNRDYEPYALQRDATQEAYWTSHNAAWFSYKDQTLLEQNEVLSNTGTPYTVFTPYSRKWRDKLTPYMLKPYPTEKYFGLLHQQAPLPLPTLASMGFACTTIELPPPTVETELLQSYADKRNFPSLPATSRLGVHLRFGTISIRQLAKLAQANSDTFLNELAWRDFYFNILHHFPRVGAGKAFKADYDLIKWRNNEAEFRAWTEGQTGYPIVDAGMRELNTTGFMHNRVRMIVASFLCKHLLIDWRWGEAYFAKKLLDFDLAANNGGWQWAAGSGCDAAPYFRVFNPTLQTEKFDKDLRYIRRWVPEFQDPFRYPRPIVVHEEARKRCLEVYAAALKKV